MGKGRHQIKPASNVRGFGPGGDFACPFEKGRDAPATITVSAFGAAERRHASIRVHILPRAIVDGIDDQCVVLDAQLFDLVQMVPM